MKKPTEPRETTVENLRKIVEEIEAYRDEVRKNMRPVFDSADYRKLHYSAISEFREVSMRPQKPPKASNYSSSEEYRAAGKEYRRILRAQSISQSLLQIIEKHHVKLNAYSGQLNSIGLHAKREADHAEKAIDAKEFKFAVKEVKRLRLMALERVELACSALFLTRIELARVEALLKTPID